MSFANVPEELEDWAWENIICIQKSHLHENFMPKQVIQLKHLGEDTSWHLHDLYVERSNAVEVIDESGFDSPSSIDESKTMDESEDESSN